MPPEESSRLFQQGFTFTFRTEISDAGRRLLPAADASLELSSNERRGHGAFEYRFESDGRIFSVEGKTFGMLAGCRRKMRCITRRSPRRYFMLCLRISVSSSGPRFAAELPAERLPRLTVIPASLKSIIDDAVELFTPIFRREFGEEEMSMPAGLK